MAANPIQIVPLAGEAPEAPAQAPNLTYRGGPLISSVQAFVLYWGTAWTQDPLAATARDVDAFFDYVVASPLIDQLAEYSVPGETIGHGAHVGSLTVTDQEPAASVTDADIQSFVEREIASGAVPSPGADYLYFVFLPPGVSVSLQGSSSCQGFCGYHSDINGSTYYAVMPYPDCTGCMGALSTLDALTATSSHELCEAITDPIPGEGWYDDTHGEIGDICAWQTKKLDRYTVQLEWSNSAGQCV